MKCQIWHIHTVAIILRLRYPCNNPLEGPELSGMVPRTWEGKDAVGKQRLQIWRKCRAGRRWTTTTLQAHLRVSR